MVGCLSTVAVMMTMVWLLNNCALLLNRRPSVERPVVRVTSLLVCVRVLVGVCEMCWACVVVVLYTMTLWDLSFVLSPFFFYSLAFPASRTM
jgi:hypothetical protein